MREEAEAMSATFWQTVIAVIVGMTIFSFLQSVASTLLPILGALILVALVAIFVTGRTDLLTQSWSWAKSQIDNFSKSRSRRRS